MRSLSGRGDARGISCVAPSLRVRAYNLSNRAYIRMGNIIAVLHQGIWLGIIDDHNLDETTAEYYACQRHYFDKDYNSRGLLRWESSAIDRFFGDCLSMLVGAAGGGREALALAQRGYDVVAFECNPALLKVAELLAHDHHVSLRYVSTPPSQPPKLDRVFDGAVVGWGGYMHIPSSAKRIAFLRDMRRNVRSGAPLLLSFFTRSPISRRFLFIQRIASGIRKIRSSGESVEIGDTLDGSFDHYFTRDEIETELQAAGFKSALYREEPYAHVVALAV